MPRNLEFKCRIVNVAKACEYAQIAGAKPRGILVQEDTYFVVPHGRMKLRQFDNGAGELIVYHRPAESGERWSTYRKIDVTGCPGLKEALSDSLGIACVVNKRRHLFLTPDARIHVDEVEGLGTFVEFEVTNEDVPVAERIMMGLREVFGLAEGDGIAGSYADMAQP